MPKYILFGWNDAAEWYTATAELSASSCMEGINAVYAVPVAIAAAAVTTNDIS
jgi:hypothetical protein